MSIRDAAHLVISSLIRSTEGEIYILNMGELIRIYDVAICLIRSHNMIVNKDIKIQIIGLKKGEKIIEELFTESERKNLEITEINNIYRLKNYDKCKENINSVISKLYDMIIRDVPQEIIKQSLLQIFPSLSAEKNEY
jgi:FlaA1/EpsC-like NDP-sugar epimerase